MQLIRPNRLQRGDTIGVIAPASPVAALCPRRFERGLQELRHLGFKVIVGQHALKRTGHTAGTIEERLDDLHGMFRNLQVKAIIATIGGFNSHQLLENIDFNLIRRNPKILMGYSDITALLAGIYRHTRLVTFMGPAILPQFGEYGGLLEYTKRSFERVLMRAEPIGRIDASQEWTEESLLWDQADDRIRQTRPNAGMKVLKSGTAQGPILAGNMGTLLLLAGTPYFPDVDGVILCLEEDENERPGTIDRFLTQLRQMGIYRKISALIVGRFQSKVGFSPDDSLPSVLSAATKTFDFPILYDADFGHTDPMMVLPNGVQARIDASDLKQPIFEILDTAVH